MSMCLRAACHTLPETRAAAHQISGVTRSNSLRYLLSMTKTRRGGRRKAHPTRGGVIVASNVVEAVNHVLLSDSGRSLRLA
jgi:hypothetical protein